MEDYFDDYEDDFDEGGEMGDDQFEDGLEEDPEMDEQFADDSESEDETDPAESRDGEFTVKDAFIIGGAMGWAYEEGRNEKQGSNTLKRKKKLKKNCR